MNLLMTLVKTWHHGCRFLWSVLLQRYEYVSGKKLVVLGSVQQNVKRNVKHSHGLR